MFSLLVYEYNGHHYIALLGGTQGFKDKADVLTFGTKEVFTVDQKPGTYLLETIREVITKADLHGIKNIRCIEDLFSTRTMAVIVSQPPGTRH